MSPEAARLLRSAVRADGRGAAVARGPVGGLVEAAQVHRVQGYVVRALEAGRHADPDQLAVLRRDQAMAAALHARAVDSLGEVSQVFAERGIPWLVVKGPVLTEVLHDGPGMRSYGDIDVLVAPRDLGRALRALEEVGAIPAPASWRHTFEQLAGELPVFLHNGQVIDLHWDLVNSLRLRRTLGVESELLFDRSTTVAVGGVQARTTDAVDTLLHLCLHAAISGGNRLIWLKDIELAAASVADRWDEVVARAETWRVGLVTAVMLTRTHDVLGLALPDDLQEILARGRGWIPLTRVSARLSPVERSVTQASVNRMVVRATSHTTRASYVALARKLVKGTTGRLLGVAGVAPERGGPEDERWRTDFLQAIGGCA